MDEIIKINRVIKSGSLKIAKLKKYIGRQAEVTIHIRSNENIESMPAAGMLKKYAQPGENLKENATWALAVKEKYDHR